MLDLQLLVTYWLGAVLAEDANLPMCACTAAKCSAMCCHIIVHAGPALQEASSSEGEEYGGDSETASPTIPALRASPFSQGAPPVPPLLPRVDGAAAVKTPLSSSRSLQSDRPADHQQQQQQGGGAGAVPIPRLNLSASMHSNLETRNAVAELQVRFSCFCAVRFVTWLQK